MNAWFLNLADMELSCESSEKVSHHLAKVDEDISRAQWQRDEDKNEELGSTEKSSSMQVQDRTPTAKLPTLWNMIVSFLIANFFLFYCPTPWSSFQKTFTTYDRQRQGDTLFANQETYMKDYSDAITRPQDLSNDSRILHEIPKYVLDYAPLVYLYSGEQFWPCDIAEHLFHVTPELNYTPIQGRLQFSNLTNLNDLNEFERGRHVYLTSDDNVENRPDWLGGQKNIPDEHGEDQETIIPGRNAAQLKSKMTTPLEQGGRSDAPAVLITVNKGNGIVDAFWFFFYSYNLGNIVFNIRWGNHIGDWEHTLVRFQHGKPKLVFYSEHYFGEAYNYSAVEKIGKRPVVYSATGTHAMYATPGTHPYVLPLGILHDETDRGPLWDPALNSHMYTYNHLTDDLRASNNTPYAPTEWFFFNGHWGDRAYPMSDKRQYGFFGEYHYVSGPLGPRFKHLGRRKVCQGRYTEPCVIKDRLDGANELKEWPGVGEGEDWPDPEMRPPGLGDD